MEGWGESKEPILVQSLLPSGTVTEVEPAGTPKFSPTGNQPLWSEKEAGYEAGYEVVQCAQLDTDTGMKQKTKAEAPHCSPPQIHSVGTSLVSSYPVCHLAEDSKLMENVAGKIQTKAR